MVSVIPCLPPGPFQGTWGVVGHVHRVAKVKKHASSPVVYRYTFDLFAQVPVQVADEGIHHLPLVIFHLGLNLRYQEPARRFAPLYPARVLDVLPAPFPHPAERRVRATEGPFRVLQDGLQFGVDSWLRNDLENLHDCALLLVGGRVAGRGNISVTVRGRFETPELLRNSASYPRLLILQFLLKQPLPATHANRLELFGITRLCELTYAFACLHRRHP
jgi:hypothetical protein